MDGFFAGLGDLVTTGPVRKNRHRLMVMADQAASTLSNAVVTILVASRSSPTDFGYFALTLVAYQFAIGAIRSMVGEPLFALYSDKGPSVRRRIVSDVHGATLFVGVVCAVGILGLSRVVGSGGRSAFVALAIRYEVSRLAFCVV